MHTRKYTVNGVWFNYVIFRYNRHGMLLNQLPKKNINCVK